MHVTPVGAAIGYRYLYLLNPAVAGVLQRLNALGLPSTLRLDGITTTITTSTTFGPATILVGEDNSVTFFVPAGTTNTNTHTHTALLLSLVGGQ